MNPFGFITRPLGGLTNTMIQSIAIAFLKKAAYALIGQLIAFFAYAAAFHPQNPDQLTNWAFVLIIGACTGLVAALKRLLDHLTAAAA